jgi:hypothetical protein
MKIKLRSPKNKRERTIAALRSTDADWFVEESTNRIVVTGKNLEGEVIYLGDFSQRVFLGKDGMSFSGALEQIRFGA